MGRAERAAISRRRILEAAQRRFAEEGYERTTVRAVGADAEIDPSMVMRYFGSKHALFAAATAVDLHLDAVAQTMPTQLGRAIAERFLDVWESPQSGPGLRILLATAGSAAGRERITEVFEAQLAPTLGSRRSSSDADGDVRAALVASQLLGFALGRYVLRLPALVGLDRTQAVDWLAPTLQRYLEGPSTGALASPAV
jgi:AcrR family transcriptional regulator